MERDDCSRLPIRNIPVPRSISAHAQNMLAFQASQPDHGYPPPTDIPAWLALQAGMNEAMYQGLRDYPGLDAGQVESHPIDMGGVAGFLSYPRDSDPNTDRVVFDIHGGGLICGDGEVCRLTGKFWAMQFGVPTYSVDYSLLPLHPYPAPLDDCLTAYRFLLGRFSPGQIIVQGASAGGNLAAALALRVRDLGLPFPAGLILVSPEVDLTESGDSFQTNLGVDTVLKASLMPANLLYAGDADLADPYLSPLFADFTKGFPPTLITTGTRDLFLSNAVRMHNAIRRAGNCSELLIEEAMPHCGFGGAPEDQALSADIKDFANRAWAGALASRCG